MKCTTLISLFHKNNVRQLVDLGREGGQVFNTFLCFSMLLVRYPLLALSLACLLASIDEALFCFENYLYLFSVYLGLVEAPDLFSLSLSISSGFGGVK